MTGTPLSVLESQSISWFESFVPDLAGDDNSLDVIGFNVIFYGIAHPFLSTYLALISVCIPFVCLFWPFSIIALTSPFGQVGQNLQNDNFGGQLLYFRLVWQFYCPAFQFWELLWAALSQN